MAIIDVKLPHTNDRVFAREEGCVYIRDDVFDWLWQNYGAWNDWDHDGEGDETVFSFSDPKAAIYFKLTWGGC